MGERECDGRRHRRQVTAMPMLVFSSLARSVFSLFLHGNARQSLARRERARAEKEERKSERTEKEGNEMRARERRLFFCLTKQDV